MAILKKTTLLALTLAAASVSAQSVDQPISALNGNQTFGPVDVISVFAGIMDGILHTDNEAYLLTCMNGTESIVGDIENMVVHFKEGGSVGIAHGIMDIGKLL